MMLEPKCISLASVVTYLRRNGWKTWSTDGFGMLAVRDLYRPILWRVMSYTPTAIRHLAASRTGKVLAAAELTRFVHLYDLLSLERLGSLDTILDSGGRRFAVSADGRTVAAGAYHVHGIAAYSSSTGEAIWQRKDLKKVQQITFNGDSARVWCGFDSGPCESLNATTGKSGRSLRGVLRVWESDFAPVRILERKRNYAIADFEAPVASIPRVGFAVLSAGFSPSQVCISEAAGPVRVFDTRSGAEVWRHTPPQGTHFLRVAFCEEVQSFFGVSWPFEKGGQLLLQRFAPDDGSVSALMEISPASEVAFCLRGSRLITDRGVCFDVVTGRTVGLLAFPDVKPSIQTQ